MLIDAPLVQLNFTKPSEGKTMLSLVKKSGRYIHEAHVLLQNELQNISKRTLNNLWSSRSIKFQNSSEFVMVLENEKIPLISASIILNWICGRILNVIPREGNLHDAELWFNNISKGRTISQSISKSSEQLILNSLRQLNTNEIIDALPYLTEVFETGDETANQIGNNRKRKKNNGIYYTPTDVIDFIISRSVTNSQIKHNQLCKSTWYDPAVGTGSFLLSVLKYYRTKDNESSKSLVQFCEENLFGSDISPLALQSTTYILATYCKKYFSKPSMLQLASIIGAHLAIVDSTTIRNREHLAQLFPDLGNSGVDFIVSNPPYSKRIIKYFDLNNSVDIDFGNELYPHFLKLLLSLSKEDTGGGGMVVPLSLVASAKANIRTLRRYLVNKNGSLEFFNFDRTPDSLFGDDVKTRNTIFFFHHAQFPSIRSTYLHRWTSRNREELFRSITTTILPSTINIDKGVPKVGDKFGVSVLMKILGKKSGALSEILIPAKQNTAIVTKATAYNWIPVEFCKRNQRLPLNNYTSWSINSPEISAYMVYAILNSRLTYWLWRLYGDGFHLTNQFIKELPFGRKLFDGLDNNKLHELGVQLWTQTKEQVVITRNAGVISRTYCPLTFPRILDSIDALLIDYFGLTPQTLGYLRGMIQRLIVAGREGEHESKNKMKYLKQII